MFFENTCPKESYGPFFALKSGFCDAAHSVFTQNRPNFHIFVSLHMIHLPLRTIFDTTLQINFNGQNVKKLTFFTWFYGPKIDLVGHIKNRAQG